MLAISGVFRKKKLTVSELGRRFFFVLQWRAFFKIRSNKQRIMYSVCCRRCKLSLFSLDCFIQEEILLLLDILKLNVSLMMSLINSHLCARQLRCLFNSNLWSTNGFYFAPLQQWPSLSIGHLFGLACLIELRNRFSSIKLFYPLRS